MRLRRICAWCGAALDSLSASLAADTPVTHGICPSCLASFRLERAYTLEDFLERLEGPVVLVDADGVFLAANSRARAALGKDRPQWLGRRGGEVIDCLYAQQPGGCGASAHCRTGCVIRRSVTATLATGRAVARAEAQQTVRSAEGERTKRFEISTERAGELILLRIDEPT
jgi:PAS domain-containing protein